MHKNTSTSQELYFHKVSADQTGYNNVNQASRTALVNAGGRSNAASILTPQIRHRAEWARDLEFISRFDLPQHLHPPRTTEKTVHYVADSFDKKWLAKGKEALSAYGNGVTTTSEEDLLTLERLFTILEVHAYCNPTLTSCEVVDTCDAGESTQFSIDIQKYWVRKRIALGGGIPCIPVLSLCIKDDNEAKVCSSDILGDCPLPFKQRDYASAIVCRSRTNASNCKRSRSLSPCKKHRLALSALLLSTHVHQREELELQHSYASLFELAYLRKASSFSSDYLPRGSFADSERHNVNIAPLLS